MAQGKFHMKNVNDNDNLKHKCLKIAEVQILTLPKDQLGDVSRIFTPCYAY